MYCIYKVTNKINNHTYIGQHKYYNENKPLGLNHKIGQYWGSGKLLHRAYKKYGKQNFEIEVLYQRIRDKSTVNSMEIWMISRERKSGHSEYNIADGGQGGKSFVGHHHTINAKQAISESSKARWADDNYRNKVITSRKATYMTDEYKLKASKARKGHKQNKDWVYKRTRSALGNTNTKDTKWFNNGIINIRLKSSDIIPEGFVPGRMYFHRRRRK